MAAVLLKDVHEGLDSPEQKNILLVAGSYHYYHYMVDDVNDIGWGCGYRTLQTICSWLKLSTVCSKINQDVPSLRRIQEILVEIGDKQKSFVNSREWIGSFEIFLVLDVLFEVPCKVVHVEPGKLMNGEANFLIEHFNKYSSPVMMGGNVDNASKCIIGISYNHDDTFDDMQLLILDPHFNGSKTTKYQLQQDGWISWQKLKDFDKHSFYNFCLPQIIANT